MENKSIWQMYEDVAKIERKMFVEKIKEFGGSYNFGDCRPWIAVTTFDDIIDAEVLEVEINPNGHPRLTISPKDCVGTYEISVYDVLWGNLDNVMSEMV